MKVRFLRDHTTQELRPQSFKEGEEVDFYEKYADDAAEPTEDAERQRRARARASADHFVKRGLAEPADDGGDAPRRRGHKEPPRKAPPEGGEPQPKGQEPKGPEQKGPGPAEPRRGGVEPPRAPLK